MTLSEEVAAARQDIRTDEYSMSVGEWISIYERGELDVHPEFQRIYRWTERQKTRLIESLLLGIPIPPIFVSQREDGVWDVIDGVQRLSTIFEFVGILRDEAGSLLPPLTLEKTDYIPSLEGAKWAGESPHALESTEQLQLRRAKITVSIVLKESEGRTKFDLFQRLNGGGAILSNQEMRSCILVMVDSEFYQWLKTLAANQDFQESIALSEKAIEEQYDIELALRFLILNRFDDQELKSIGDLNEFLTAEAIKLAEDPEYDREQSAEDFRQAFGFVNRTFGSHAFRRYDPVRERHVGGFLISAFELVALGVGANLRGLDDASGVELNDRIQHFWSKSQTGTPIYGAGVRASTRIPIVVAEGRGLFDLGEAES